MAESDDIVAAVRSTTLTFEAKGNLTSKLSKEGEAELMSFLDLTSAVAKQATITSVTEIQIWEAQADEFDVEHIIEGDVTASSMGVPVGPFDDERAAKILKTIRNYKIRVSDRRWTKAGQIRLWLVLLIAAAGVARWLWPMLQND